MGKLWPSEDCLPVTGLSATHRLYNTAREEARRNEFVREDMPYMA